QVVFHVVLILIAIRNNAAFLVVDEDKGVVFVNDLDQIVCAFPQLVIVVINFLAELAAGGIVDVFDVTLLIVLLYATGKVEVVIFDQNDILVLVLGHIAVVVVGIVSSGGIAVYEAFFIISPIGHAQQFVAVVAGTFTIVVAQQVHLIAFFGGAVEIPNISVQVVGDAVLLKYR